MAVSFTVTPSGAAVVSPSTALSLPDGTASTSVVLGSQAGAVTVTATATGLTPVTFSLTAVTPISPTAPLISAGGVVSAGLSLPAVTAISPNAIVSIFGQNFAPAGTARLVGTGDLVNGKLPTMLAGVCVQIGGLAAPVLAVFPTQLNVQVPQIPAGSAGVQVTTQCGTGTQQMSTAITVTAQATAPEFFYFTHNADGTAPIAALDAITGAYIGAAGLLPGTTFTPATPGEYLTLFGTGFGTTNPPFNAGDLPTGAAPVTAPVTRHDRGHGARAFRHPVRGRHRGCGIVSVERASARRNPERQSARGHYHRRRSVSSRSAYITVQASQ